MERLRFYDVYTLNQSLQKRLSLNLRPPYSKDRIHKATERIIEEQKEQLKDS